MFDEVFAHLDVVFAKAASSLDEFKRCNRKEQDPQQLGESETRSRQLTWQPPPSRVIKVNCDTFLYSKEG